MKKIVFMVLIFLTLMAVSSFPALAASKDEVIEKITYEEITDLTTLSNFAESNVNSDILRTEETTAMLTFEDGCTTPIKAKCITQLLSASRLRSGDTEKEYVSTVIVDLADAQTIVQTRGSHTHEEWNGVAHDKVKAYAKNYYSSGTVTDGSTPNVGWYRLDSVSARFTNTDGSSTISNRKMKVAYGGGKLVMEGGQHVNHTASWNITKDSETKKSIPIKERYAEYRYTFRNIVSCTVNRLGTNMNLSVECLTARGF